MNFNVTIDWKFVLALGGSAIGIILATKIDSCGTERVLARTVDTYKGCVVAGNGNH